MYQFFVDASRIDIADKRVTIIGKDCNHIKNVLRMKPGEEVAVSDGQSKKEYRCAIRSFGEDCVELELRFIKEGEVELPSQITLFQGLPKADKLEMIIQKAVELGVYQVVPVETKRSVVKLDDKKAKARTQRWQAIAEAAAKQSKRALIPQVSEPVSFAQAVQMASQMSVRLIPYELAEGMDETRRRIEAVSPGESIAVFIGPEGGFDEAEIESAILQGIVPITLGRRILRTETAGLTVLSWLMYRLEGIPLQ